MNLPMNLTQQNVEMKLLMKLLQQNVKAGVERVVYADETAAAECLGECRSKMSREMPQQNVYAAAECL